jgi:chromosome condensin MukBEF MukE localization factor
MANTTKYVRTTFDDIVKEFQELKDKKDFLIEIESIFDNSSWDEILTIVDEARVLKFKNDVNEPIIDNIIQYVQEKKKITFKQWKVLRLFINDMKRKPTKFKYEK